jgi:hypothetical protein
MNTEISRQPPPASPKLQSGKALTDAFHPNQKEKIESFE